MHVKEQILKYMTEKLNECGESANAEHAHSDALSKFAAVDNSAVAANRNMMYQQQQHPIKQLIIG